MDSTTRLLMMGAAGAANPTYVEDVFSTYLYTGNGSTQTITNGIDLSGKGGLVWFKGRTAVTSHFLQDSAVGWNKVRKSNTTDSDTTISYVDPLSNGFTWYGGSWGDSGIGLAFWTFRKAPKFFDVVTYTGDGSNRTIAHNLGSVPGCIIVKRTDAVADWQVYHRSLANTEYIVLNSTAAKATGATRWNSTTPTSTVFSLGTDTTVNASGGTYVAYLFAHDAGGFGDSGNDSVVSCGSFTTDGSGNATVNLGWEPQWLMVKDATNAQNWYVEDSMRGFNLTSRAILFPSLSNAEATGTTAYLAPSSTGFSAVNGQLNPSSNYVYIAIRRGPMKTPTDATKVFGLNARSGTGSVATVSGGQIADAVIIKNRGLNVNDLLAARLTGTKYLDTSTTAAESTGGGLIFQTNPWDVMDGVKVGTTSTVTNASANSFINYLFRRAPGFFDVVAYTGTGLSTRDVSHNLGVTPELAIVKCRNNSAAITDNWWVGHNAVSIFNGNLNDNSAWNTYGYSVNIQASTASALQVGLDSSIRTYIAYLFATCPGVSKVGSYTGTGTTLQINCGFTAGARFVMTKRTDANSNWFVWDTARGISSGNDPYWNINGTAAEVTTNNYINPYSPGFEISSTAPAAINASGGTFIYLAIA